MLFFLFFNTFFDPYFDTMDEHWHKILMVLILTMVMHKVIVVLFNYLKKKKLSFHSGFKFRKKTLDLNIYFKTLSKQAQ